MASGANSGNLRLESGSGTVLDLDANDGANVTMGSSSNVPLILTTNTVERMRIEASGDVGIGTMAPSAKLDVSGGKVLVETVAGPATSISAGEYYNDNSIVAWGRVAAAGGVSGEFGVAGGWPKAQLASIRLQPMPLRRRHQP